jgi:hypothetical protein
LFKVTIAEPAQVVLKKSIFVFWGYNTPELKYPQFSAYKRILVIIFIRLLPVAIKSQIISILE